MLESIPDNPTPSDISHLERMEKVIDALKSRFGMNVIITAAPNTVANEAAVDYTFENRPFFKTTTRLNPADPQQMDRLFKIRREQMGYFANAEGLAVIDSDPGGYSGSTDKEFVDILNRYMDIIGELNPDAYLYYWMWVGWQAYNRMWEEIEAGNKCPELHVVSSDFENVLNELIAGEKDNWKLFSCWPVHQEVIKKLGLQSKSLFFPYGVVEGEPTFPFTNLSPDNVSKEFSRFNDKDMPLGVMANSQTHAVQLPNTYLFAKAAGSKCMGCDSLEEFADSLIPGEGLLISQAWQALQSDDSSQMYALVPELREKSLEELSSGSAGGLLLMTPGDFLADLALQLEFRADVVEFMNSDESAQDNKAILGSLTRTWRRWQSRTGFSDAYMDTMNLHPALRKLGDENINKVLDDFNDWRDPGIRHGIVPRLLDAITDFAEDEE